MDSTKPNSYYVMGTGSRSMRTDPNAQEIFENLKKYLLLLRQQHPGLIMISGMAEGWDEAIAKAAMFNKIPFIAAIPNPTYGAYYWGQHSLLKKNRLAEFQNIIGNAIDIVFVCQGIYQNGLHANFVRNQWMVDKCNSALAFNPASSGTRDAIARLESAKKPYLCYPFTEQLTLI